MKMNLALVILGGFLVLLGAAVMIVPGLTDDNASLGSFSGPTSLVLIVLGIGSVFAARFNHVKTPIIEAQDESEEKPAEVPAQPPAVGTPGQPEVKP